MPELRSVRELSSWLSAPAADTFPYDAVLDDYLAVGKHFVAGELLGALHDVRLKLPGIPGRATAAAQLAGFLDVALDKQDERYDYTSYLALSLLPLPGGDGSPGSPAAAAQQHDRLFTQLLADTVRFELAVHDGECPLLPRLRPDARLTVKRLRLAARVSGPALHRLGLPQPVTGSGGQPGWDAVTVARQLLAAVAGGMSAADWRVLRLTMLPVWVAHDEYMFIRVLQSFETTFALLAVYLRAAVTALAGRESAAATAAVDAADRALGEAARAFSLIATMQVESFLAFRQYTEGASAIQSGNYKTVESLCASPQRSRLDSAAYLSVPGVRQWVLDGHVTLDDLVTAGTRDSWLSPAARAGLTAAMLRLESTMLQWRQTHYRLAVRMLGDRSGTGYTEGTPYLKSVRSIRLFGVGQP